MRKKALYVITKSNFGGAQRYVFDMARSLPKNDFDVSVAFGETAGGTGRLSRLLLEQGIRTIVISELGRDVNPMLDWRAFQALIGLFSDERPDVVHLNSSKAGGLGALAARIVGVPRIIFTAHGLPFDEDRSRLSKWAILFVTWLTVLLSHRTIAVSKDAFDRLRAMPFVHAKVVLVYNGIQPPEFETPAQAIQSLQTIDPKIPSAKLVGMIAELHPNKDLRTAIDAIALTDMHLVVMGEGELKEALRAHAQDKGVADRVHFVGFVPDAARYVRAFDVFLLTSFKEGLPYVLLEAQAACVPIVAVDIPGVRDIVLPEFTGIVAPRDPQKIADALKRVASDSTLSHSLVEQASKRVIETFSLSRMLERTNAQY